MGHLAQSGPSPYKNGQLTQMIRYNTISHITSMSDMSDFSGAAQINTNWNLIFHFSTNVDGMFAIEHKTIISHDESDLDGMSFQTRSYASSEMTGPILLSEIIHHCPVPGYFKAVWNGMACFVRITPSGTDR